MKKIITIVIAIMISLCYNISTAQTLWGMNLGSTNPTVAGTITKINEDGSGFQVMHIFDSATGYAGNGSLLFANNKFYGMTITGGAHNDGVIFSYDSTTNTYTDLHDFSGTDGRAPMGSLIDGHNGLLYGMTSLSSTNNGVIFSLDLSSNTFTVLYNFDGTHGQSPQGDLFLASNGVLYGMTSAGGLYTHGVVFKFDTSSHIYTDIHDFHNPLDGYNPHGSFMQTNNGLLYGMTQSGGSGVGIIFTIDPSNDAYTVVYNFIISTGYQPYGSLIQATNGLLYGMTYAGGLYGTGIVFSFNPTTNTYMDLFDLNTTIGCYKPNGDLLEGNDGKLYGQATNCIFSFDTVTHLVTVLHNFTGPDGGRPRKNLIKVAPFSVGIPVFKSESGISVYPNPANNTITIHQSTIQPNQQLTITDVLGNKVFSQLLSNTTESTIDIGSLSNGIYFYEVRSSNETSRGKFVVQH